MRRWRRVRHSTIRIPLFLLCLFFAADARAQAADSLPRPPVPVDTAPVYWLTAKAPEERMLFDDTLPDYRFRMYDPAREAQWADWGNLGLYGSAARPLLYETTPRAGFTHGFDAFRLYRLRNEDLRYFQHTRTFSEVGFTQGRTQNDNSVDAMLSRTFAGGTTAALMYQTNLGVGQYRHQSVRNASLAGGLRMPFGKRYEGFLSFCSNLFRQQENGGLTEDADFGSGQFSGPINAPIRLATETAQSLYGERRGQYVHYYRFTGKNSGRQFKAGHHISYGEEVAKFSHSGPGADTLFYDTFMVDRRGIRQFTRVKRLDNHVQLSTFKNRSEGRVSDVFTAGLRYDRIRVDQEPGDTLIQNWFLTGSFALAPSDRLQIRASGEFGLLDNLGEYQVQGSFYYETARAGRLEGGVLSQRYPPPWIFHRLNVSGRPFWQNDFEKPLETTLWAAYQIPGKLPLRFFGRTHLINQFLYFDAAGLARQTGEPLQLLQLGADVRLTWRFLRLDQTFTLQQNNREDVLRLPTWFSRSALYAEGRLFQKKLLAQGGFDFRINSDFMPDAWQPVTGQFYLNDQLTQEPYPWLDAFVDFKLLSFRFFFRFENLGTLLWDDSATFQQTAWHPHLFNTFRLGFKWRFLD